MKTIHLITLLILATGLFSSCKKHRDEPTSMGQPICASEQFRYTQAFSVNGTTSPADVDFTLAPYSVSLTAGLNENVSWTITITGQSSGAVKTYTGRSTVIDIKWWGNADGNVFFQDGEDCQVALIPSCREATVITVKIIHKATFDHFGLVLLDLDHYYGTSSPMESVFNIAITPADPSPQGGNCHMINWPAGSTGWYAGSYIKGLGSAMPAFVGGASSDEIYANFYLKGDAATLVKLVVWERVNGRLVSFGKTYSITWTGWKMISLRLSDINVYDPNNILEIDVVPSPTVYNGKIECYVDFLILTKGKPFSEVN